MLTFVVVQPKRQIIKKWHKFWHVSYFCGSQCQTIQQCSCSTVSTSSGFEELSLRASGQVAYEVKSHEQILELTLEAWGSMEQSTFSAAWLSCGYVDVAQMNLHGPGDPRRIVEEARASLSDMFSCLGKNWTPQRCMSYEWQIQDCSWNNVVNMLAIPFASEWMADSRDTVIMAHRINGYFQFRYGCSWLPLWFFGPAYLCNGDMTNLSQFHINGIDFGIPTPIAHC